METGEMALKKVQRFYPRVRIIKDAVRPINIEVTRADADSRAVKNHRACAMAMACQRKLHLDGAIVSRAVAYLIKARTATRYSVPNSVTREIISFDRGAAFSPGDYYLLPPKNTARLGSRSERPSKDRALPGNGKKRHKPHVTTNIRAALGGVPRNGGHS